MKYSILVWMFFMCCLINYNLIHADLTEIEICILAGEQTAPDIDGDVVVWQDSDGNLYRKLFGDPNDPNVIAAPGQQMSPAISGDVVVWYDVHSSGGTQKDIYGYSFATAVNLFLTSNDGKTQKNPAISGNTVVWQDFTNGNYDIAMYNLLTETSYSFICTDTAHQYDPVVSGGGVVVWMDTRSDAYAGNDIYMCDLTAGPPYGHLAVSPSDLEQWYPAISGDLIAWEEIDGEMVTIVVYNVVAAQRIWEHTIPAGLNAFCDVYHDPIRGERFVVWQQSGEADADIMAYDLNANVFINVATGPTNDSFPAISGRKIVWQRNDTDIYGAEIPSPTVINIDSPVAGQMILAGSEVEITWTLAAGDTLEYVDIAYSSNSGTDPNVIAENIPFDDYAYTWSQAVDVDSQQCRIYLTDAEGSSASGRSDLFTIFQCTPHLVADLTGDCFVGMDDFALMAAQWLTCGNPYDTDWCSQ